MAFNSDHVRWIRRPELRQPVLVAAFTGWNDAGDAASSAVQHLIENWKATPLAEIDPEQFTDFATVRPHVRLVDGSRRIVWPTVGMWSASTPGADLILVLGPEPALQWRLFTEQLMAVAEAYEASTVITLGALLADVSHRREVQVLGTGSSEQFSERHQLQPSRYEGPTGIVGVLNNAATVAGLRAVALWAAVPAYAPQVPSPTAAAALARRAADIIGTPAPVLGLDAQAAQYTAAVEELLAGDEDLTQFVSHLDALGEAGVAFDEDEDDDEFDEDGYDGDGDADDDQDLGEQLTLDGVDDELPEATERLLEEVERFLRDQPE